MIAAATLILQQFQENSLLWHKDSLVSTLDSTLAIWVQVAETGL